ncbi:hypothetical protein PQC38_gp046 [Aeromonas phage BUCT695]|uniref:hypothetical protein n=1 Tax=Aeromonas phage BUCT695 TaxID=2908630 RepID=UPI0023291590|nr:hypothetical protein PQC38_gp046 [Aeromonas phage BUCT695]UIW10522.1 hypothetical protein [Aeromonas phage BUCT695]
MRFKLTNGEYITFNQNIDAVKFVLFAMPFHGLEFDGQKPSINMNDQVRKLMQVADIFEERRRKRLIELQSIVDAQCYDDHIPF